MNLEWVQQRLREALGFSPYPATLNVRPAAADDQEVWRNIQNQSAGLALAPKQGGFCSARLYPIEIVRDSATRIAAAILLPDVKDYPGDKIEIVAPVRLKDHWGVNDGDRLTWEFVH